MELFLRGQTLVTVPPSMRVILPPLFIMTGQELGDERNEEKYIYIKTWATNTFWHSHFTTPIYVFTFSGILLWSVRWRTSKTCRLRRGCITDGRSLLRTPKTDELVMQKMPRPSSKYTHNNWRTTNYHISESDKYSYGQEVSFADYIWKIWSEL